MTTGDAEGITNIFFWGYKFTLGIYRPGDMGSRYHILGEKFWPTFYERYVTRE